MTRIVLSKQDWGKALLCGALARAIAFKPQFQDLAWAEIEKLLGGRASNPKSPRKRGYSNVSIKEGKQGLYIEAPITLAQRCRFVSGRLILQKQRLPETLLNGLDGQNVRKLVDHPVLGEMVIASGNRNFENSWFRLERDFVPLMSTPFAQWGET